MFCVFVFFFGKCKFFHVVVGWKQCKGALPSPTLTKQEQKIEMTEEALDYLQDISNILF